MSEKLSTEELALLVSNLRGAAEMEDMALYGEMTDMGFRTEKADTFSTNGKLLRQAADAIAALERELEESREQEAKQRHDRISTLRLFWQAITFAGGQFRIPVACTERAPDDLMLVDYRDGDDWVIEARREPKRDAALSPAASELAGDDLEQGEKP